MKMYICMAAVDMEGLLWTFMVIMASPLMDLLYQTEKEVEKNVCGLPVFELGEEQIRNANKEKTIVVICSGGGFSDVMKNNALKSGFMSIVVLKVGLV